MPGWLMEAGEFALVIVASGDFYLPLAGFLCSDTIEARKQTRIRGNYTWAGLYVRVTTNTSDVAGTITSRINGGNGNQTITIPLATTGVFEDNVSSDNIANNDLVNWLLSLAVGTPSIYISIVSSFLTAVDNVTIIEAITTVATQSFGATQYSPVLGTFKFAAAEVDTQLLLRQTSTLSNLRAYISLNTLDGASTLRLRKNAADVNQVLSIGAGISGDFEDAVSTDAVASGDRIDYCLTTAGTAGILGITITQMKSAASNRWSGCSKATGVPFDFQWGTPFYIVGEGSLGNNGTEANVQTKARGAIVIANLFVRVVANTCNDTSTCRTRINGGDGNLIVSIGALATGEFEDTVNSDSYAAADLFDFQLITGGVFGQTLRLSIISVEQQLPAAPAGLENKSAHMGSKMIAADLI